MKILGPNLIKLSYNENQNLLKKKEVRIDERGIREFSDVVDSFAAWQGVDRIEKTKEYLFVYIDKRQAFIIPLRNFPSPQAATTFCENAVSYWEAAKDKPVMPSA